MRMLITILTLVIGFHAVGCSPSVSQKELDKARAETEVARAEAAAAKAESARLRAALPATNPSGTNAKKSLLSGSGIAMFADGKVRAFTSIRNLDVSSGQTTVVGIVGGGERELASFKFYEVLAQKGEPATKGIGYKERDVRLDDLARISFGPEKMRTFTFNGTEFEMSYCEIELEGVDGKKESFPCILSDYPHHRPLTIVVQYADGVAKDKLENAHLYGMTFRVDK